MEAQNFEGAPERSPEVVPSTAPNDIECTTVASIEQSNSESQEILQAEALDPPLYDFLPPLQHSCELIKGLLISYLHVAVCQLRLKLSRLSHLRQPMLVHSCSTPGKNQSHHNTPDTCAA